MGNKKENKGINVSSYNPLNEYEYNPYEENENGKINKIYDDDIYDIYGNDNNSTKKKENKKSENINKNNEKKEENIRYVGDGLFKEESANFISQMKKKKRINSYSFSIKYDSNNDESGEIIIGDLPHEYAPEIYSSQNYFFDHVSITKEPPYNWHFKYKKLLYDDIQIDSGNSVKFSIDFGFIKKLENILPSLIKLITHPDLKVLREKFPIPPKDLVTGLYTPNYDSPFYKDYIIKPGQGVKKPEKKKKEKIIAIDTKDLNKNEEGNNENENKEKEEKENEENKEENVEEGEEEKKEEVENPQNIESKYNASENEDENNEEKEINDEAKIKETIGGLTKDETLETNENAAAINFLKNLE